MKLFEKEIEKSDNVDEAIKSFDKVLKKYNMKKKW